MSIRSAFSAAAKRYQGGIAGLGEKMGQPIPAFYKKVLGEKGYHLECEELELGLSILGTPEVAQECAAMCNHICVPIGTASLASDDDLRKSISELAREFGRAAEHTDEALVDAVISRNEEREIVARLDKLIQVAAEMKKRVHRRAALDAQRAPGAS